MSDRFFLDTNVLVYAFDDPTTPKTEKCRHLIRQAHVTRRGVISYQVVQEFFNAAHRRVPGRMSLEEAEQVLWSVLRPLCIIHSSPALFLKALQLVDRFRVQWYDALIVAGAIEAKCGILYSEDFQNGQKFDNVEVQNPFL